MFFCVEQQTWQGQALPLRSTEPQWRLSERSGTPCGCQAPLDM